MNKDAIILVPRLGQEALDHAIFAPFLGTSLLERHIRFAIRLGVRGLYVVTDSPGDVTPVEHFLRSRDVSLSAPVCSGEDFSGGSADGNAGGTLLLRADYLVEEPILRKLVESDGSRLLVDRDADGNEEFAGAGWAAGLPDVAVIACLRDGESGADDLATQHVADFPAFNPSLRRHRKSGWLRAESAGSLDQIRDMLIDGSQKGSLDIPAKFLHAPIENTLVSTLSGSNVTPNQITVLTTAAAWLMTWLMLSGQAWLGLAGAAVIGILDGVDGKLARMKLMTSRLGEMEHLLDMMFEYSWWLALGWTLSGGDAGSPLFWMAIGLILCNFGDTLAGVLFWAFRGRAVGRTLDNYSLFDLRFRLVGGRRNIYIWMLLLLGPVFGLANAFTACFAWGVVTVLVRLSRALLHIARPRDEALSGFIVT